MLRRIVTLGTILLTIAACTSVKPERYKNTEPSFLPEEYFLGKTRAWGMFQDRKGEVKRRFTVDLHGVIEGDELVLTENFAFDDGERSQRVWRISKTEKHRYEGRAEDVVGIATGLASGHAMNWQYDLLLEVSGRKWKVHFNDWMFLQEDGMLINRATMSKFGLRLGEVTIFFAKQDHETGDE